jgi:hypothetical protein
LGDYEGAEPIIREGYKALAANPEIPRTADEELIIFYERWNAAEPGNDRAAKLADWRNRLHPASGNR